MPSGILPRRFFLRPAAARAWPLASAESVKSVMNVPYKRKTLMQTECEISRFAVSRPRPVTTVLEDSLVTDARAGLTPAQMVDRKLVALLSTAARTPTSGTGRGTNRSV